MVVIDLDDTLCNLRVEIQDVMEVKLGLRIPWSEWTTYELARRFDKTPREMLAILARFPVLERAAPEPGAAESVRALRELGHQVGIVSARGWHPQALNATRAWLSAHAIAVDFLHIVRNKGALRGGADPAALAKCDAIRPLTHGHGPITAYVDDCLDHVRMVRDRGLCRLPMVYDMPWNRSAAAGERVDRVTDLMQLPGLIGPAAKANFVVRKR